MKILHTSDWHFGMNIKMRSLLDDQEQFLEQLYEIIKSENIGAVICAGDIYDSSVSGAAAIRLYSSAVRRICIELRVPFIVIAGNHDSGARLASHRELLELAGYYVSGKLERDIAPVLLDGGRTAVYPIPYFSVDEVRELFPEKSEEIRTMQDAFETVTESIRSRMDSSRFNCVVSHAFVTSAELCDSDRSAIVGTASAVSLDVFRNFDYVALGHIHKPQQLSVTVRYSGSPLKYSFGAEEKHEKQVVVVDTENHIQKTVPITQPRERRTLSGTLSEIMSLSDFREDYLRIELTDRLIDNALSAEIKEKYPLCMELYGLSSAGRITEGSVSVSELSAMTDMDVLQRFFEKCGRPELLGERQKKLFLEAAAAVDEALAAQDELGHRE